MSSEQKSEMVIGGTYRHYKKKQDYKLIGVARHSETLEEVIIYEALYENKLGNIWVRPKEMFLEFINTPEYKGPRFELIQR
jgi:hypothetical protein